jgi:hypothetical protein
LGALTTDSYEGASNIIWVYFLGATLFSQIIFMNMLITLMADTFENVSAAKPQLMRKAKAQLFY